MPFHILLCKNVKGLKNVPKMTIVTVWAYQQLCSFLDLFHILSASSPHPDLHFSLLPFWTFLSSLSMYIYLSALPLLLSLFTLHRSTMSKLLSVLSLLRLHFINISSSLLHLATLLLAHFKLPCSHANFCLSPRHPVWPFPESHLCLYTVLSSTSHSF